MSETILDKFLRYIKIDTQSDDASKTYPSTKKQLELAELLTRELKELGIRDANTDLYGYVTGTIESNLSIIQTEKIPVIGFIAHLDTATNLPGKDVKPQVIENYKGGDIPLPANKDAVITENENPFLKECIGDTIITTDGTTLLGGDDKAGIAAIMTAVQYCTGHPEFKHGAIKIGFTPDEEIGAGTKYFDINKFGADFAYTIDGGMPGKINKETFSANSAVVEFTGKDIHPGHAKNIMVNSIRAMADFISLLPREMAPETTDKYEPYIHPQAVSGEVSKSTVHMILRDFKTAGLDRQKEILEEIITKIKKINPATDINLKISESYRNMADYFDEKKTEPLDYLWDAVKDSGITPEWEPIRGGTDGSRLTEKGLPTPNIFTGTNNAHSLTEWVSLKSMELASKTILNIIRISVNRCK